MDRAKTAAGSGASAGSRAVGCAKTTFASGRLEDRFVARVVVARMIEAGYRLEPKVNP